MNPAMPGSLQNRATQGKPGACRENESSDPAAPTAGPWIIWSTRYSSSGELLHDSVVQAIWLGAQPYLGVLNDRNINAI